MGGAKRVPDKSSPPPQVIFPVVETPEVVQVTTTNRHMKAGRLDTSAQNLCDGLITEATSLSGKKHREDKGARDSGFIKQFCHSNVSPTKAHSIKTAGSSSNLCTHKSQVLPLTNTASNYKYKWCSLPPFFTMFFNKSCKSKGETSMQTAWGLMIGVLGRLKHEPIKQSPSLLAYVEPWLK